MGQSITMGEIRGEVVYKPIKNLHLSVYPPSGAVRISAPMHMELDTIRAFALTRLGWIKKQRKILREQERETRREFLDRESHFYEGKRYLLQVVEEQSPQTVILKHSVMKLRVRPGADHLKRRQVMEDWYRKKLKEKIPDLIGKWSGKIGKSPTKILIQKMKTKWGSCNPASGVIRLNLELAKKPPQCLEYIVVHEMLHLLEPTHNQRFRQLMSRHYPMWESSREELNRLPVRHEDWEY